MNKKSVNKRKSQKDLCDEAQSLFMTGSKLEQIAETLSICPETLKEWQSDGLWERKKELVTEHPKLMGEVLKGLVKEKIKKILSSENQINLSNIEELTKIINLIDRLEEHSWDERAAVVAVMSLFGKFARRQLEEKEELQLLAKLMEKFFEEMEED